jgi:hypothetical protein
MSAFCPHCGAQLPGVADPFCPECRQPLDEPPAASQAITPAEKLGKLPSFAQARAAAQADAGVPADQLQWFEDRIAQLEQRLQRSNLFNESFMTRAFAVWGHNFVASLIIVLPFYVLAFCAGMMLHH